MSVVQPHLRSADLELLNLLTASTPSKKSYYTRREAPLDPLLLAAAISVGPQVTRHHYHHDVAGGVVDQLSGVDTNDSRSSELVVGSPSRSKYISRQAPRSQRVKEPPVGEGSSDKENDRVPFQSSSNLPTRRPRGSSFAQQTSAPPATSVSHPQSLPSTSAAIPATQAQSFTHSIAQEPLVVQCMARTRIPTPYGHAFLHLYKNNKDAKEHLAIVADSAQLVSPPNIQLPHFIRSKSLDAKWSDDETEMDRLIRGAYIGRLSPSTQFSAPPPSNLEASSSTSTPSLPPLVRIHSECFTGETIGSMRCDCGEQLDEALRMISLPPSTTLASPGRGAVIYLRQEGRGIGLLSKIRAYNLQDMGHDTVQANLLLGHGADERRYDIAAAILRDLGLDDGLELLTNNPDKVESLEREGVKVVNRRAMVPRSWQQRYQVAHHHEHACQEQPSDKAFYAERVHGATLIGGGVTHGDELDRYLRTKVERMGHMLDLSQLG